jgi:hypothetical protein
MTCSIFDIETDGLIETVTKIHCLSVIKFENGQVRKFTLTSYLDMVNFFRTEEILVGHNIIRYDIPVVKKILGIEVKSRLIDTLPLSWYLYPNRQEHGLESWGEDVGVPKPPINDWENLTIEEYIFRCESDTEINAKLFDLQINYLKLLYGTTEKIDRIMNYLMFKMDCAREQEEVKWKLDVAKCQKGLDYLYSEFSEKAEALSDIMPKITHYRVMARPKKMYKKDGTLSTIGEKWMELLKERGLPDYHLGSIKIPVKEVRGNSGSHQQLKDWLFSLGWIPETFKYVKDEDGSIRKIPQLNGEDGLCKSVKKLIDTVPELELLDGLFILKHRIGLLEGFMKNKDENDFVIAAVSGLTNTLRFKHTIVVNLPTIPKPYWEEVRGCLIAPDENHVLCGSDMSSLEDNTKRHYMYYYDPEYVKEMMTYRFDAHCDIAVLAGKMSRDDEAFYKWYDTKKEKQDCQRILDEYYARGFSQEERMKGSATGFSLEQLLAMPPDEQAKQIKILKPIRLKNKKVNFAGIYGAGAAKIALTADITLAEAKELHQTYWKRNWSVKKIAASCIVKTIGGQMWQLNPVSQFWYSLRSEKDKFSTLNQGTGVYCFDSWVRHVRRQEVKLCGQFHDEIISPVLKTDKDILVNKLEKAINQTNDELQLNVKLGISKDFGNSYAEIH